MLFSTLISSLCQSGWHGGSSGPRPRHREEAERHTEGGLRMLTSEFHIWPIRGTTSHNALGLFVQKSESFTEFAQGLGDSDLELQI